MDINTILISSTTDGAGQAQQTIVTQPPPNDGGGGGLANRGANYFFGFLITFVVLLLVFVGCGIGSRRRYLARREASFMGNMEPWAVPGGTGGITGIHGPLNVDYKPPILYERPYEMLMPGDNKWADIKPLAIILLKGERLPDELHVTGADAGHHIMGGVPTDTVHSSHDGHTQMLSQSQVPAASSADNLTTQNVHDTGIHEHRRRPLLISVVAPLGGLRPHPYKRTVSALPTHPAGNDVPEALQIAVMIVMPSPNTHNCSASQPLHSWNEKTWPGQNALQPRDEPQRVPSVEEKQDSIMQEVKEDGSAIRLEVSEDVQEVARNADENPHELLPEYQIGVATIPWYVDLDSRPPRLLHPTS